MKILDIYLLKQFIQTIIFGLLAFTFLFVVIDMMERLDDFIDQDVSYDIIIYYYLVFIPEIVKLMTPVAVLFSALFTVGKASTTNELTAIKSSGISIYRFMIPFLIITLFISLFSIYFSGYVVPKANKQKVQIEMEYLKRGITFAGSNIFFQDSKNRIINISFFDINRNQANRVIIQEFDNNDITKMTVRYDATHIIYDSLENKWLAFNINKRTFGRTSENSQLFDKKLLDSLNFLPDELLSKQQKLEEMNLTELKDLLSTQVRAGNETTRTLIEYYSRFSFGMASFVVVLFGLPLSANKRKGGLALQFGINILITFIYLAFMQISQAFGKNGALDPVLTAWLANLIFLAAAVINFLRVQK